MKKAPIPQRKLVFYLKAVEYDRPTGTTEPSRRAVYPPAFGYEDSNVF